MNEKSPRSGFLSLLTKPLAKAAQKVRRRDAEPEGEEDVQVMMDRALEEFEHRHAGQEPRQTARLTDESFRLLAEQLREEDEGAFQIKLHVISLVEFHEAVGDRWFKVSEKVMMIAEGVINMHLGAGNMFGRQGTDFFILLFRNCDNNEARRRAVTIAQELGTRLVGDQFVGEERPLALAAELSLEDGLYQDGSLNMDAVDDAVAEIRSLIPPEARRPNGPPAWLRSSGPAPEDGPRSFLTPCAPAQPDVVADGASPNSITGKERGRDPGKDPGWESMQVEKGRASREVNWVVLEKDTANAAPAVVELDYVPPGPLPADARLALVWRPSWVAAGESIGVYQARVLRVDDDSQPAMEGSLAYPQDHEAGAQTLDRFCVANAIRDFRAADNAGNTSSIVIPIHWATLAADNRMDFLAPFADLTQAVRESRVVVDVFGVPADVRPITLGTVIEQTRKLCREVVLRTRLADPRAALAADCGVSMIGVDLSELAEPERTGDAVLLDALKRYHEAAAKARLGCYVWGVRRRKVVVGAIHGGYGLVNGPALMKDIPKPGKVLPAPKARITAS